MPLTLIVGFARSFSKLMKIRVLNLFLNDTLHDAVIPVTVAQHPGTYFLCWVPCWVPILELLKTVGTPQPLQCHCFLQCMLSMKDEKICSTAVMAYPELNVRA